jgi:predicted nucleic acid-binding protein
MAALVDTNVLLRLMQPHSPHSPIAEHPLNALRRRKEELCVVSQNLIEFWVVATRPMAENGLGLTVEAAHGEASTIRRIFRLLPELPLHAEWERLVNSHRVSGKSSHDARLVAAMKIHGIQSILTFNTQDFSRYADITVLDPANEK